MDKNKLIMILAIGAGGYLTYWYLTKHGPTGPAYDAAGNKIAPSYWDTWFGSTPAGGWVGSGAGTPVTGTGTGTSPIPSGPPAANPPLPPTPPATQPQTVFADAALQSLYESMVVASGNQTSLSADQWSFYMTQALGSGNALTAEQFGAAFPGMTDTNRGGNMTADQFLTAVYKSQHGNTAPAMAVRGMHGIIRVPSTQQPSMAFSNARRGAFAGKGSYIQ